jgi:nucleoid-associated protein YejK
MFARPSKMLPGKWQLVEYYYESDNELINLKEAELLQRNFLMQIQLNNDNSLIINENLDLDIFLDYNKGGWLRKRNFVSFVNNGKQEKYLTFQFDAGVDLLKLLKKDDKGKIDFFGFFKRIG